MIAIARPLKRRRIREHYSSGLSRDFHGICVRDLRLERNFSRLLTLQIASLGTEDEDEDDDMDLMVLRTLNGYAQTYFEKVMPATLFGRTFRRNCDLTDVLEDCGTFFRFRKRCYLKSCFELSLRGV